MDDPKTTPPQHNSLSERTFQEGSYRKYLNDIVRTHSCANLDLSFKNTCAFNRNCCENMENDSTRDETSAIKIKATKHRDFYKNLCASFYIDVGNSGDGAQMAGTVTKDGAKFVDGQLKETPSSEGPVTVRQRRTGVFELQPEAGIENIQFQSVKLLTEKYQTMLAQTSSELKKTDANKPEETNIYKRSKSIDDTHLLPPPSGYCSSSASAGSDDERNFYEKHPQVQRSGSSDSAVGLTPSDDELSQTNWPEKNENKTDYTPIHSPYSPRGSIDRINVPTKTLIEAQYLPFPLDRKNSDCGSEGGGEFKNVDSRRQSVFTDDGDDTNRCRYWRTPSVVVSDYSDDMIGLTLEDIEYFRNQRKENSSSPDSSLHSSCSNLNYCGSSISNLESENLLRKPYRKVSDCSLYSFSGDEDTDTNVQSTTAKQKVSAYLIFFNDFPNCKLFKTIR